MMFAFNTSAKLKQAAFFLLLVFVLFMLSPNHSWAQHLSSTDHSAEPSNTEPKSGTRAIFPQRQADDLIVIAHRGASGYRPEHTLAAYRLAIRQGADFIEPDLVATRDGHLIARHENELSGTTDVADHPEFAARRTTKFIDSVATNGWFSEDFTLAEIKTLRARERIPEIRPDNTRFDDRFEIPTLAEIIDLVRREQRFTGRRVGIYPETKHPTFFAKEGRHLDGSAINISLGQLLIDELKALNFTDANRVFIQSFEVENLIELAQDIMPAAGVEFPLVQLFGDITDRFVQPQSSFSRSYDMIYNAQQGANLNAIYGGLNDLINITETTGYSALANKAVLNYIANHYASGLGPWKNSFLLRDRLDQPVDGNGDGQAQINNQLNAQVHPFLSQAIAAGLLVHPYTLRAEENFLTLHPNGQAQSINGEVIQLLSLGVNGFFIDQPDQGVLGRFLFERVNRD